jgi:predicted glutamine amidotransferase
MAARMCRMMGVVSRGPVYYDLFEEFADLATQGMCPIGAPDERGHQDGWGLACFQNGALKVHARDAGSATDASKFYGTAWKIAKLNLERASGQSLIVMGHLRRASAAGLVGQKYAHPFIEERDGVTWAFQHNGSLVKDPDEPGLLDSQVLFRSLLDHLTGRAHEELAKATTAVRDMAIDKYGGFTSLNFMLSDGDSLHVYRDFQTNGGYYTLYMDNFGEMVIAASEPILAMAAEPIPRGVLHTVTSDLQVQRTTISHDPGR